jgi:hypothetical protein
MFLVTLLLIVLNLAALFLTVTLELTFNFRFLDFTV